MTHEDLRIDGDRLLRRISDLAAIGPIDGGGSCRLALTDEDRDGRDLVVTWMHDLGLDVAVQHFCGEQLGLKCGDDRDNVMNINPFQPHPLTVR